MSKKVPYIQFFLFDKLLFTLKLKLASYVPVNYVCVLAFHFHNFFHVCVSYDCYTLAKLDNAI